MVSIIVRQKYHNIDSYAVNFPSLVDECRDISTVEELSLFYRWEENGVSEEHFLEIIHLHEANANRIYSAITECLKQKELTVNKIVGMRFEAKAFSGTKTGVQAQIKKVAPHALFVHCHCNMLQLACVQAANSGIKHVYVTLVTLWKFFHYFAKRTECLQEIQRVLK